MSNRILDAYVITHRADPTDAELRIVVRPERITPTTEIKGRLMGPRTPYASTVEIAYPYREVARADHLLLRVLIPEPNFWEPKTPLLYKGPLELWQDGACVEQIKLRHGIRSVQLGGRGLRVNGKPCTLAGISAEVFTADDAKRWHDKGLNLVVLPAHDDSMELWTITDHFGLFVLGRIDEEHQWPRWPLAAQRYPSYLGCVIAPTVARRQAALSGLIGAEVSAQGDVSSGRCDFAVIDVNQQATFMVPTLVKIGNQEEPPAPTDHLLGWIRRSV